MFILPLSHEQSTVRRWPILTVAIVAINVLALGASMFAGAEPHKRFESAAQRAQDYADFHAKAAQAAPKGCVIPPPDVGGSSLLSQIDPRKPAPDDEERAEEERAEMVRLCDDLAKARDSVPEYRFGFIPSKGTPLTLLTSEFMHGGFLHLIFNMWFFWLCGCNLEDRWGRIIFPSFYLLAGAVGAILYAKMTHMPDVPLIGASGAVAGAMGAFLAVLAKTRIRFFYIYWLGVKPRWGTFEAAAYWMLPLWLLSELFEAVLLPEGETAHWAHVGGFAFGVLVGGVLKLTGIDAKLDQSVEESITTHGDARVANAAHLSDQGRFADAIAALETILSTRPDDVDALVELVRATTGLGDPRLRVDASVRLMSSHLAHGFADAAADVYKEIRLHQLETAIPRDAALSLGEAFARRQKQEPALFAFRQARRDGLVDLPAVKAGVAEATVLVRMKRAVDARSLLDECKMSPFLTHDLEQRIDAQLAALGPGTVAMGDAPRGEWES